MGSGFLETQNAKRQAGSRFWKTGTHMGSRFLGTEPETDIPTPYTADICMATLWGLSCYQWPGFLPYFYPVFFFGMIIHRYTRDMVRCQAKYGKDWKIYCERVPYAFTSGVI